MLVYTKIDNKLACFQIEGSGYADAIKIVRDELGLKHRPAILALVKG